MRIRNIKTENGTEPRFIAEQIGYALKKKGYVAKVYQTGLDEITVSNIRLSPQYVARFGKNRNALTDAVTTILGWINWVVVNQTLNDALDNLKAEADIKNMANGVELVIRRGSEKFGRLAWEEAEYSKVGKIYFAELYENLDLDLDTLMEVVFE